MIFLLCIPVVALRSVEEDVIEVTAGHGPVNPADLGGHVSVHPRDILLAAPDALGHDADLCVALCPLGVQAGADQGAAPVPPARVLAGLAPGAGERVVEPELPGQPGRVPQLLLTRGVTHHRHLHLLHDHLVRGVWPKVILAPSLTLRFGNRDHKYC